MDTDETWQRFRNTPTGVGKTARCGAGCGASKKHPHGRGEDLIQPDYFRLVMETPPRAWGRRLLLLGAVGWLGNTPTGVGKTFARLWRLSLLRKHPHGRGEDALGV